MTTSLPAAPVSRLRQRLIDDMNMRRFSRTTQRNYLRDVGRLATYLGRPPDTATAEDLRLFQIEQRDTGVPVPTMNSIVAALRYFFTHTIDRPDLARRLVRVAYPRKLPVVLSRDEVARLSTRRPASSIRRRCRSPMARASACSRSRCSRSATSTASACCSGSNAARAASIATPCCRTTC
ncbi:phage integrase family protein [Lutibaculum baratangense AMV1]|uniref:Phage integrase family protein n=1 Tax=Lutibaculum baratangense AMV1 TaxID=631454 RepID=V4R8N2_9HYPH|nr:phage integrase family protein [Lutibaculum baratangense AMV1]